MTEITPPVKRKKYRKAKAYKGKNVDKRNLPAPAKTMRLDAEMKRILADNLPKYHTLAGAAKAFKIKLEHVYDAMDKDANFKAEIDAARLEARERLEAEAFRRAHDGVEKPVFYKGKQCGTVTEYSDTLMIKLLQGNIPEKYNRNQSSIELTGANGGPIEINQTKSKLLTMLGISLDEIEDGEIEN